MFGERRIRMLTSLIDPIAPELETKRLCQVSAEVTGMSGAGIMLMFDDVPKGSVCTTNEVSALVERLQFELGEGPCVDLSSGSACAGARSGGADHSPLACLHRPSSASRRRGHLRLPPPDRSDPPRGLNLYRDRPGPPTDDQHAPLVSAPFRPTRDWSIWSSMARTQVLVPSQQ